MNVEGLHASTSLRGSPRSATAATAFPSPRSGQPSGASIETPRMRSGALPAHIQLEQRKHAMAGIEALQENQDQRPTPWGGFHTPVRGPMFVRNGAVTPGPSRECDITCFVKDDQNLLDNRVTVQGRRAGCRASPYRHPGCHANVVPPVQGPLFKKGPTKVHPFLGTSPLHLSGSIKQRQDKFSGRIFLGHQGRRYRDIPDPSFGNPGCPPRQKLYARRLCLLF